MGKQSFPSSLILISLVLFYITIASVPRVCAYRGMVGGRKEIKDVKANKEVQELGEFSVREFNQHQRLHHDDDEKEGGSHQLLEFSEVVGAEVQVVAGLKYYLKVRVTTREGETRVYDSVVVVKPWLGRGDSKKLLSFLPSTHPVLDFITVEGK